jgi:hypothetical protein
MDTSQQSEQARAGYPDRIDLTWVTSDRYHYMQSTVWCLSLGMQRTLVSQDEVSGQMRSRGVE